MAEILIQNALHLATFDSAGTRLQATDLLIRDGRIAAIRSPGDAPIAAPDGPRRSIDASRCLVLPGLINMHGHAAMSLLRGYADDYPLMPWLQDR